jgi:hypothetical protein
LLCYMSDPSLKKIHGHVNYKPADMRQAFALNAISLHTSHQSAQPTQYKPDWHLKLNNAKAKAAFRVPNPIIEQFEISSKDENRPSGLMENNADGLGYMELTIGLFIRANNLTNSDATFQTKE